MTLQESVAKLSTLLPKLSAGDAKFASDLIFSFTKYKGLTPKQEPWIGKLIARAEKPAFSAPVSAPSAVNVGGFEGVVALFTTAKEHLKFPKVRLVLNGTKIVLSLNGAKSSKPGHVSIASEGKFPNRSFFGSVSPDGVFTPFRSELPGLTALLSQFATNPSRVAKDHGKLTGNCCFCNKVLGLGKEKRSVLVGFGPDCAEHYGLKAEWSAALEKAEAKASVVSSPKLSVQDEAIQSFVEGLPAATLTVSPAAQATINELAESLAKATGAVAVTVTDGPLVGAFEAAVTGLDKAMQEDGYGPNPGDLGDYVEQTHPEFAQAFAEATFTPETLESIKCKDCGASPEVLFDCDGEKLCQGCKDAYEALWAKMKAEAIPEVCGDTGEDDSVVCTFSVGHEGPHSYGEPVKPGVTCFFCEEQTTQYASLHGYQVCPTCVKQLGEGVSA